jgi:hypothetical protein
MGSDHMTAKSNGIGRWLGLLAAIFMISLFAAAAIVVHAQAPAATGDGAGPP